MCPFLVGSIEDYYEELYKFIVRKLKITPKFCYIVIISMQSAICLLLVNSLNYLNNPNAVNK